MSGDILGVYRRDGTKYGSWREWAEDFERRDDRRVARTDLWWGGFVSTVWLGLDHRFVGDGPPLIFESMVFGPFSLSDWDMERYSTEAQARAGHDELVRKWADPVHLVKWLFTTGARRISYRLHLWWWNLDRKEQAVVVIRVLLPLYAVGILAWLIYSKFVRN